MRRQSRPFIVEVKKKRGDLTRQRSIWGKLDLAAIGAQTAQEPAEIEQLQVQHSKHDVRSKLGHAIPSKPATELPSAEINQSVGLPNLEAQPADRRTDERVPPQGTSRKRRKSAESLPRGQRWKRRLPKLLRRGK